MFSPYNRMRNGRSIEQAKEASGFRLLANSLPGMIFAMSNPKKAQPARRLGGISSSVAEHLKAEICSIFLLRTRANSDKEELILEEAFGYDESVIGTKKHTEKGLTAKIVNEEKEFIANFTVQDHDGWSGELDDKLQGHCWCLLGVPIVASEGKVRGVIKVENKRSEWAEQAVSSMKTSELCTFLKAISQRRNTPKAIAGSILKLTEYLRDSSLIIPDNITDLLLETERIAELISNFDLPFAIAKTDKESDLRFDSSHLYQEISSLHWHVSAVTKAIQRIQHYYDHNISENTKNSEIQKYTNDCISSLTAIELALTAYQPFDSDDVYLMRTVAAMIAAAIDIRESARTEAYHALQHALKEVGGEFLQQMSTLVNDPNNSEVRRNLYKTALYISGPYSMLSKDRSLDVEGDTILCFKDIYYKDIESRVHFYEEYVKTYNRRLICAKKLPKEVANSRISNIDLLSGAIDIILVNAVEHGKGNVEIDFKKENNFLIISIVDEGQGFSQEFLTEFDEKTVDALNITDLSSTRGQFGLKSARRVLRRSGAGLKIRNTSTGGAEARIIIGIKENNCDIPTKKSTKSDFDS